MQGRRSKLAASKTGDRGERGAMQKNQDGPSKVGKTSTSTDLGIAQWATGFALLARYDWAEMFSYEYISVLLCTCKVGGASVTVLTCSQVQADKQTGNLKAATYLILC